MDSTPAWASAAEPPFGAPDPAAAKAGRGLVVLSRDPALLETFEGVLASTHRLQVVALETDLAGALMDPGIGVALIDAAAVSSALAEVARRLRAQFPDLVLVVAGGPEDQAAVASQVASGAVYRFLHKPVSEQRVKLFVEAAMRRHDEEHVLAQGSRPALSRTPPPAGGLPRQTLVTATLAALIVLAALAAWLLLRGAPVPDTHGGAGASAPHAPAGDPRLAAAREALARGELVAPAGRSAADLYRAELARNPANQEARDGLERVIDQLCSLAEREISAQRLDEASRYVASARSLDPQHVRVSFLTTEIAKDRERATLAAARQAAASGNFERAISVLDGSGDSSVVQDARRDLEQQKLAERVRGLLKLAADKQQAGALLEPAQDNARFYVESAHALAPADPLVRQVQRALNEQLVEAARKAATAGDFGTAERWLRGAEESGAPGAEVSAVRAEMQRAQLTARADNITRLSQLFNERLAQKRILDPANDSARYYLGALRQADPAHPATEAARAALAKQTLQEAREALGRGEFADVERWSAEAAASGAAATDLASIRHDLDAARARAASASAVVSAATLERVKYVEPRYPDAARARNLGGWVDVEFTVRADGSVGNVHAVQGEPRGVFERAALDAISGWRFRPVLRDGVAVEQRAALRIRFALER